MTERGYHYAAPSPAAAGVAAAGSGGSSSSAGSTSGTQDGQGFTWRIDKSVNDVVNNLVGDM